MTWLVFGVSCLLVLAGAVSIISGAPIIQLERGWAEVISGTVALSSGGVVFALATVLLRLEQMREALGARETAPAAVPQGVSVETLMPALTAQSVDEPAPVPDPMPMPPPEPPEPVPAAEHGLWKRIRRPAEQPAPADLDQQGFPDRIIPDEAPASPQPAALAPVIVPPHPTPAMASEPVEPPTADDGKQIGWLERSLGKTRDARPAPSPERPATPEPAPTSLFGIDPTDAPERREPVLDTAPPVTPARATRSPAPPLEPEPTPDLAAERHEGVDVIGRYQAGTSSYVMYSDGTIEVETEDGQVHRFGSMDELKAYIASQDSATA